MSYEVDAMRFEGERSGDAFALRWSFSDGSRFIGQKVAVIDGGFRETGERLVDHIKRYYGTDQVDLVISTHPDSDHINGLKIVLEQLPVSQLAMHLPWNHTEDIASMFHDGRVTDNSVSDHLRASLQGARDLETLAVARGIPIIEPFAGVSLLDGDVVFAGPSLTFYEELLPHFRGTPEPTTSAGIVQRAAGVLRRLIESFGVETLTDEGTTSPENESSAVTIVHPSSDRRLLFVADAGRDALTAVADALQLDETSFSDFALIQVPHHGSRHNVDPTVLNRIVGPKLPVDEKLTNAIVSAGTGAAPRHPAKQVTNAFRRRGAHVLGAHAQSGPIRISSENAPPRLNWHPVTAIPMYDEVEDD